jgi:hypothetical protein
MLRIAPDAAVAISRSDVVFVARCGRLGSKAGSEWQSVNVAFGPFSTDRPILPAS